MSDETEGLEYEYVCGESVDHDEVTTYRDEDIHQWECRQCGAEGWEDLNE